VPRVPYVPCWLTTFAPASQAHWLTAARGGDPDTLFALPQAERQRAAVTIAANVNAQVFMLSSVLNLETKSRDPVLSTFRAGTPIGR
jgi:hypothetical protein